MNRMLDKTVPVPGRIWYMGRWRTPEQVEHRRASMAEYLRNRYRDDPDFREKERRRAAAKRIEAGMTPRNVTRVRAAAKRQERTVRAAERRRRQETQRAAIVEAQARDRRAPADVRAAWRDASPNSIIRRKFPTMAALDASARQGGFDAWK